MEVWNISNIVVISWYQFIRQLFNHFHITLKSGYKMIFIINVSELAVKQMNL